MSNKEGIIRRAPVCAHYPVRPEDKNFGQRQGCPFQSRPLPHLLEASVQPGISPFGAFVCVCLSVCASMCTCTCACVSLYMYICPCMSACLFVSVCMPECIVFVCLCARLSVTVSDAGCVCVYLYV